MAKRKPTRPSKSSPTKSNPRPGSAQQRLASQRALAAAGGAATGRRRLMVVVAPVVAVIALVAVLVGVKVSSGSHAPASGTAAAAASGPVANAVTGVPASVLNTVGKGSVTTPPSKLSGAALTAAGKPRVLYVGAEWCPYCAAERWPLAVALSRFGTLSGLGEVSSTPSDVFPNTASLSFHGATYSSTHLSLTAKEIFSNQASGNSYKPLDSLHAADEQLFTKVGGSSFPFIDIGGRYLISGASYDPSILKGKTQAEIAAALSDPSSSIGKAINGTANVITAAICSLTGNQPANVCTSAGVTAAASALGNASG
jgi:thiol-disulfide isomerase/thioredoxin